MLYPLDTNKQISIPYLLKIGNGKVKKLGKYLVDKNLFKVVLFFGEGIENMLAEALYEGLDANNIQVVRKQVVEGIAIEDITKEAFSLPAVDAILGLGGGKALDFAKYAAYLLRIPYISVPTSLSNDGFCSPVSSLTVGGKRRSVKSAIPFGVVMDLDVLATCPEVFVFSGIGDMISKVSALWDWKEATARGQSRYNDFASLIAYNSLDLLFLKHSYNVKSQEFYRSLANSLLMSGIAMEIAGSSRPASGSEHLISHALDKLAKVPDAHGIQVGVATILCTLLQNNQNAKGVREFLSVTGFVDFVAKRPLDKEDFIKALHVAPTIKDNYFTILSQEGMLEKAEDLLKTDELLKKLIQ